MKLLLQGTTLCFDHVQSVKKDRFTAMIKKENRAQEKEEGRKECSTVNRAQSLPSMSRVVDFGDGGSG